MNAAEVRTAWPLAMAVADEIVAELRPYCERLEVAGSLRRRRETVKDIEVLVIPRFGPQPTDMFGHKLGAPEDFLMTYLTDALKLTHEGGAVNVPAPLWKLRPSTVGGTSFGNLNKLLLRRTRLGFPTSFIAVDIFTGTAANWGRDLWVRTGPARWNQATAALAIKRGGRFHAYGPHSFTKGSASWGCPDEASFAQWLGVPLVPPAERADLTAETMLRGW